MHLNIIQLAESFGVEENVVESWIRNEGLPCIHDRGRLLFDRSQVVSWATERGRAAKAGFLAPAASTNTVRRLDAFLQAGGIWRDLAAGDVVSRLESIVAALPGTTPEIRRMLAQRLHTPGGITWAPVGSGFALPHLRAPVALGRDCGLLALLILREPLPLPDETPDEIPVTHLLFFIAPSPRAHLELLSQLSSALTRGPLARLLQQNASDTALREALARTAPGPEAAQ